MEHIRSDSLPLAEVDTYLRARAIGAVIVVHGTEYEVIEKRRPVQGDLFLADSGEVARATLRFTRVFPILRRVR
jgi:hypothetical protein